ncbi:MAG: hypothetical protein CM15mP23_02860 [Cryomorphaceae bacterium]|nr:MAG: hypothetical protein CM15mP23_02860 [Cryomorphaceae bacterium]
MVDGLKQVRATPLIIVVKTRDLISYIKRNSDLSKFEKNQDFIFMICYF